MKKLTIPKPIFHRKIQIKSISNSSPILPSLTQSFSSRHSTRKILSPPKSRIDLIETQISSSTKRLAMDKINLRLLKERLLQKKNIYDNLEGKPDKILIKKKIIKYKLYEPTKIKKGREREVMDERIKSEKEKEMKEYDFKKVTDEIDILIQENRNLIKEINFSRKKKLELEKLKNRIIQEILYKKNKLNEINKENNQIEKTNKKEILEKEITKFIKQEKKYDSIKDYLEEEYNKVIQEYIRKEREKLNEIHFNRKIAELRNRGNMIKYDITANQSIEIKNELKKYEDEKIDDRIPILDVNLEKWRQINQIKKENMNKYIKNCSKIRETLDKLVLCLNVSSYKDLPEIFEKTEERESNINIKKEQLENENEKLKREKENLMTYIELVQNKEKGNLEYKNKFIEQKNKKIKLIDDLIEKFRRDIKIKEEFFERIQPETDKFLKKLNETYLSEFIKDKINIRENNKYNYLSVNKYLSNVEDYLNLIYYWEENNDTENFEDIEEQNFERLNSEMNQKLENFNKYKLINKSLLKSMKIQRKNGFNLNDIIKSASKKIIRPVNYNNFKISKKNKSKERTTENSDEDYIKFPYDTQSFQQSSIIFQNSSKNKIYS
jgi:hypothetical protein